MFRPKSAAAGRMVNVLLVSSQNAKPSPLFFSAASHIHQLSRLFELPLQGPIIGMCLKAH